MFAAKVPGQGTVALGIKVGGTHLHGPHDLTQSEAYAFLAEAENMSFAVYNDDHRGGSGDKVLTTQFVLGDLLLAPGKEEICFRSKPMPRDVAAGVASRLRDSRPPLKVIDLRAGAFGAVAAVIEHLTEGRNRQPKNRDVHLRQVGVNSLRMK